MNIESLQQELLARVAKSAQPAKVLRAPEFRELYAQIPTLTKEQRAEFGQKVNALKTAIKQAIEDRNNQLSQTQLPPIDVTAPMDVNTATPDLLPTAGGTIHPLMQEVEVVSNIWQRMGFVVEDSREIDDQYHMFETLNFPKGHPARDDYDTFMTVEADAAGDPYIAPAHTSTMQNRILKKYRHNLEQGEAIAAIVPDRVFRNEDLDARHEHTFYQIEGIYVAKGVHAGMLIATLKEFLQQYYGKELGVRVNPFYFPFTEPSFEF
ncbi:MAG: hypothetical protein KA604_04155, partial [Candidatus Saccharimonas sp.]|nr:hypothetical protein [Candidatus Saccharimonas sp.]